MELKLQGSRALVTGGTGGIGWAIAEAFAAAGIDVAAADTRPPSSPAGPIRFVRMDVVDRAAVLGGFDAAEAAFGGPVDILVNGAGIYPCDPILEMTEAAWDRVLDTNVKGMFLTSQEFCRRLVAAGRPGCIVNITSGSAERARLGAAHYCASKAAAEMLTRCFALEYTAWFDLYLPGLHSLRGVIPLGGTSNHFRTETLRALRGWDPWNVTEDCELGVLRESGDENSTPESGLSDHESEYGGRSQSSDSCVEIRSDITRRTCPSKFALLGERWKGDLPATENFPEDRESRTRSVGHLETRRFWNH